MKKLLLLAGTFFIFLSTQAQFTVETGTGTTINDGDIISFNQVGTPAKLEYYITNTSLGSINMRVQFVSAVNADGSQMQLCITPTCYPDIAIGESYPQDANAMSLPLNPGEKSLAGNHFMNFETGNGTEVIDYVFKFYQVDGTGFPIGNSLTFTYRYDPNMMGIEEAQKMAISVYPTVIEDMMMVDSNEELEMEVYSLLGSLVKSTELSRGKNQISMSDLASQVYLVRFKNENGDMLTKKIIIK